MNVLLWFHVVSILVGLASRKPAFIEEITSGLIQSVVMNLWNVILSSWLSYTAIWFDEFPRFSMDFPMIFPPKKALPEARLQAAELQRPHVLQRLRVRQQRPDADAHGAARQHLPSLEANDGLGRRREGDVAWRSVDMGKSCRNFGGFHGF